LKNSVLKVWKLKKVWKIASRRKISKWPTRALRALFLNKEYWIINPFAKIWIKFGNSKYFYYLFTVPSNESIEFVIFQKKKSIFWKNLDFLLKKNHFLRKKSIDLPSTVLQTILATTWEVLLFKLLIFWSRKSSNNFSAILKNSVGTPRNKSSGFFKLFQMILLILLIFGELVFWIFLNLWITDLIFFWISGFQEF
jgi:hypothetical protein